MKQTKAYIQEAALSGAELILFPELFTSAIGFSDKMLDVAIINTQTETLLKKWAAEYDIIIGGSYIVYDGTNAFNMFQLVFPSEEVFEHRKDIPTQIENCYYTNGDECNILSTPIGNIGIALCWEMLRYDTVKRLINKADIVLTGSCWWDLPEYSVDDREVLRQYNQNLALETPVVFAKLLGVPVIHANHCGKATTLSFPYKENIQTRQFVGAAQVIDAQGNIINRRSYDEGAGMLLCDITWDSHNEQDSKTNIIPNEYWIPKLPTSYIEAWKTINPQGVEYYINEALPYYRSKINKAFVGA